MTISKVSQSGIHLKNIKDPGVALTTLGVTELSKGASMNNFSTRPSLMTMPHDDLVWEYVSLNATKCVLEDENNKLIKENQRLNSLVIELVTLYLGRDAK